MVSDSTFPAIGGLLALPSRLTGVFDAFDLSDPFLLVRFAMMGTLWTRDGFAGNVDYTKCQGCEQMTWRQVGKTNFTGERRTPNAE